MICTTLTTLAGTIDIIHMRSEYEIFSELETLCTKPGFVHVISYFCWRDNLIRFSDEPKSEDISQQATRDALCRTEISTLIGLMLKRESDWTLPSPDNMQRMIDKSETLLKEMHQCLANNINLSKMIEDRIDSDSEFNPFASASAMREPIFYGGDSAYIFQYIELAEKRYAKDDSWLLKNKGYSAKDARNVIDCILKTRLNKTEDTYNEFSERLADGFDKKLLDKWTMLPAYIFTLKDISERLDISSSTVSDVISSFTAPRDGRNSSFTSLSDFNVANAYPIIQIDETTFLLLQQYNLAEAFYETPFFWFMEDEYYIQTAMENRGAFTESFSEERLKTVFGDSRVFSNIDIVGRKGKKEGEIDVLVTFADRAIVLQAKSKKLTIAARKGNDNALRNDFKKAIQNSYNQAALCARLLEDSDYKLRSSDKQELHIERQFKEIYVFCVLSDHYPALSFQARQFLSYESSVKVVPPFIMDVFLLDVMTEMLQSPLQFLSYVNRRSLYKDQLFVTQELDALSYHLVNNLWFDKEYTHVGLTEDVSADLDLAMMVRRTGVEGEATPDGILTHYQGTEIGNLLAEIESMEDPGTIDLGFFLLSVSEDSLHMISKGIKELARRARRDGNLHDLTLLLDSESAGLTIHCTYKSREQAEAALGIHCTQRKYTTKAINWFGICIDPDDKSLRFGMSWHHEWQQSDKLDVLVKDLPKTSSYKGKLTKMRDGKGFGENVKHRRKNSKRKG